MQQCPTCHVELEDEVAACPLCGTRLNGEPPEQTEAARKPAEPARPAWKQRLWLWEIVGALAVAIIVVTLAADFAYGSDVGWSLYSTAVVGAFWILVSALIFFYDRVPVIYVIGLGDLIALLYVLNLLTPGRPWFVSIGLPLTGLLAVLVVAVGLIVGLSTLDAFQIIAIVLTAVGVFVIGLEMILSCYLAVETVLSWSLVVFACTASLALILIVVRRRLKKRHVDLKRLFHV